MHLANHDERSGQKNKSIERGRQGSRTMHRRRYGNGSWRLNHLSLDLWRLADVLKLISRNTNTVADATMPERSGLDELVDGGRRQFEPRRDLPDGEPIGERATDFQPHDSPTTWVKRGDL